ncbi:MAG: TatD family hydrolase [Desulfobulbaceae bacterium]|nr:TatD family hydrolase [Desulfobulbaceae bacterium]
MSPLPNLITPGPAVVELIDSHCHLDMTSLQGEVTQLLVNASLSGVTRVITIGIDYESSVTAVSLAGQHPGVYASIGFHPHEAEAVTAASLAKIAKLAKASKVVAYGEIGLDYAKNYAEPKIQQRAFIRQLELAQELNLPVIIHDRDAHTDTADIIRRVGVLPRGGVMHCFSGNLAFAEEMIALGFMLSIPGIVTFKNATALHEVVRKTDLHHLMLETDGPFLAPVPYRGKRNQPAYLIYTAKKVAELKNIPFETVAQQTTANTCKLFRLPGADR